MPKTKDKLIIGAVALCAAGNVHAQYAPPPPPTPFQGFINEALRKDDPYMNKWDFGGSLRVRYEWKEGYAIAGKTGSADFRGRGADVENDYLMERLRVRAGYTDKWWGALVEGRSSLEQGDERFAATAPRVHNGDGPEQDAIDLHQAYLTLGNHKEFPVSLKVGRQELSYGDERLVGAFAWNNIGRVFDAAKLRWQNSWFGADIFTSRVVIPEDGHFNVDNDYDYFSGFYATSAKIPKNTFEFYFLSRNGSSKAATAQPSPQFPQPSARDIYTVGVRFKSSPAEFGNWDYTAELMGQFGHFNDTRAGLAAAPRSQEQQAYAAVLNGGYTFADTWGTPRVALEYCYASGDSNPNDNKHETFENLFPTNHKFYGYMDMVSLQNIHDVRPMVQLKPTRRVSTSLEGHLFWLADTHDNFYNVGGAARGGRATSGTTYGVNPTYDSYVGAEVDFITGVALTRYAQLEGGYGHFFAGSYIKSSLAGSGGAKDADFVYAQLTVNF
jgi:hypothetical protein